MHRELQSKLSCFRLFFVVEYKKGQDPVLLMTGVYSGHHNNMFIAISPDGYVVAISMGRSIGVFDAATGELEELLENVHSGWWKIKFNSGTE